MSLLSRALLLGFSGGVAYSMVEPHLLQVRHFDVALPHLPREADGLRIGQLSDLHYSAITAGSVVRRAVELCNAEQPDLVVLTGDYVSRRNSYSHFTFARLWAQEIMVYAERMAHEIGNLRAPEGVFAVPGNHDHWEGNCSGIMGLLEAVGAQALVNRSVLLRGKLPMVGLDDLRAGRPDIKKAFDGIAPGDAQVVLSHNPRVFARLHERNCLMICGHTHGGQVHLPLTDFRRRPRDMRFSPWNDGWYRLGAAQMFVSVGLGSVHFPMRFHCPPEIVIFTLRRG
jgi:uncharacterized protein